MDVTIERTSPDVAADDVGAGPGRRRAAQGAVLVASVAVAGALFWGVPAIGGDDALPDPARMAVLGDGRNSSAENVAFWQRRSEAVPGSVAFRTQLAAAQLQHAGDTGDLSGYEVGEATARSALDLDPRNRQARLVLADALAGRHGFAEAFRIADEVLAEDPDAIDALLHAGDAQLELGEYADARRRYDQVARVAGGAPAVISRYARLESVVGTADRAAELARDALVAAGDEDLRHEDAAFYWFQLASYEYRRGAYATAHDHLTAALLIDPGNGGATELLGRVLTARGEYDAATSVYEGLVEGGGAADLHGELAKLYRLAGRERAARTQIDLGLAVAARDADRFPAERRHLIGFLADHDPATALRLAELDLAERDDVYSHAWYAWALYRTGEVAAAADAIVPALRYGTEDALLDYQAGVILAAAGDGDRARALLTEALRLNPEFDLVHAAEARRLLASL